MNAYIKTLFADKIIKTTLIASFVLLLSGIIFVLFSLKKIPPYIPLYNQLTWGSERLGVGYMILLPLGLSLTFLIVNSILAKIFYQKAPLLSRILSVATFLLMLLSFIFTIRTIMLIS
jgi:hypothetical protein